MLRQSSSYQVWGSSSTSLQSLRSSNLVDIAVELDALALPIADGAESPANLKDLSSTSDPNHDTRVSVFCMCTDPDDNELETLEVIHQYVEILDLYFGNVCEVDIIFNFHKVLMLFQLQRFFQESNRMTILWRVLAQDSLVEAAKEEASSISNIISQATK
ncbi:hypothetical protein NL676_004035 [Syzygium grande]|nr:hypothetical protein NL676_004035 [Syzygium grande]